MVTAPAQPGPAPGDNLPVPGAYDLVDMPTARDELKIKPTDTSGDAFLQRAITDVSLRVANYCNRVFPVEGLLELIYLDQEPYPFSRPSAIGVLTTARWPLVNILTLAAVSGADNVLTFASTAGAAAGMPVGHANVPAATTVASVLSGTQIQLSQAISGPVVAGDTVTLGLAVWRERADLTLHPLGPKADFDFVPATGQLARLNSSTGQPRTWEASPTTIAYSAGYSPIPPDLQGAALEWVKWRFYERERGDPTLRSQEQPGLGIQTWWVGGPPKSGSVPESIRGVLDNYRVPVAA